IARDLPRRDFSMNAMAMGVSKSIDGTFIDLFNGARDVRSRVIRTLHNKSFADDPTRLMRAVRFCIRMNLSFEPATMESFDSAALERYIYRVSWERRRKEIHEALHETKWLRMISCFRELGFLKELSLIQIPERLNMSGEHNDPWVKLGILYARSLLRADQQNRPETPLSTIPWHTKAFSQALREIEHLHQNKWNLSWRISPMAKRFLRSGAPKLFKVFERDMPFYITGSDLLRLKAPPVLRGNILKDISSMVLSGNIKSRKQALKYAQDRINKNRG
ncbi:hypothetical protein ACFL6Y_09445, partial [Elusimicrobiota bacterium]